MTAIKRTVYFAIGKWYWRRYQRAVRDRGAYTVARQLRKQGVPLEVTRALVAARPYPILRQKVMVPC